jgi:myo-inositol 2-dehydrogenase/D-chiro-inositol 1-dehydrogenase
VLKEVSILLRIGIVGLGNMGKLHLLNTLHNKDVEVIAAADKNRGGRKYAEKYNVKTYDDYTKLIDSEKLDAVIISLPNFLKKDGVFYAAERKLDIFLDKPIARNFPEAQAIVQKAKKENVRLMLGVNYRYYPSVQKLKKSLDEGRIGDPVIATAELVHSGPFSYGVVPVPIPEWWLDKETSGGGALLDFGYHLIDILTWMFGDLEVVYSNLEHTLNLPVEDAGTLTLKSKSGKVTCIVNTGWFSRSIFPNLNFRVNIHGTAGYDSTDLYRPRDLRLNALKEGLRNIFRKVLLKEPLCLTYTYYYSSFITILNLFFDALKHGTELPVSLEKELEVIRIIDHVYSQHWVK